MSIFEYKIFRSNATEIGTALQELFVQIDSVSLTPVRLVLFCNATTNEEYAYQRLLVEELCQKHYAELSPMLAVIAQRPLDAEFAAEVTFVDAESVKITRNNGYITLNNKILLSGALYTSTSDSIATQSDGIFQRLGDILQNDGFEINDIVRQWNFIEKITHLSNSGQNYQQFNDARSRFYAKADWANGYPAATGIGTKCGGVTIMVDAVKQSNECSTPIDNPLQVSAHAYSQRVLIDGDTARHKSTPKFERARKLDIEGCSMIYVSGTAAIRGEESCKADIEEQTALTMENIAKLADKETLEAYGVKEAAELEYKMLRIYLKHNFNLEVVKSWFETYYPSTPKVFLLADICREELLIEIEGIAAEK
jgi:enamine deaminase RidA (YjgF/YER057c/UK114 family)